MQITLKAARVNAGFTQAQAAEKIGVDRQTIIRWETDRVPDALHFMKLCDIYKTDPWNILLQTK